MFLWVGVFKKIIVFSIMIILIYFLVKIFDYLIWFFFYNLIIFLKLLNDFVKFEFDKYFV